MSKNTNLAAPTLGSEYTSLEEQYVIRFPLELAKRVRKMIKTGEFSKLNVTFPPGENNSQSRNGSLVLGDNETFKVSMLDLPCTIETHKTLDNRNYFKSGDIGQIILVQEDSEPPAAVDEQFHHLLNGLTPATKNIRKRRWRKQPVIPKEEIKEAEAEILRLQRGGTYTDKAEIELIPVDEVDEIYETPSGNVIVTMKEGPPIRAGIPSTFTEAELQMLPKHQLDRLKTQPPPQEEEEEEEDELDAELEEELDRELEEDDDGMEKEDGPAKKKQKLAETPQGGEGTGPAAKPAAEATTTPTTPASTTSTTDKITGKPTSASTTAPTTAAKPSGGTDPNEKRVRELRTQKVNIANEIAQLQKKNEQNRIILTDEPNVRIKRRIADKIAKFTEAINSKKQKMAEVDAELAQLGTV